MMESRIKNILINVLDVETDEIDLDTDLIRDLGVESIDLLEIALSIEREFGIKVDENKMFLKSLRFHIDEANEKNINKLEYLSEKFPFLSRNRIEELIKESENHVIPSIKIKDLLSYVQWKLGRTYKEKKEYKKV